MKMQGKGQFVVAAAGAVLGIVAWADVAVAPVELKDVKRLPLAASAVTGAAGPITLTTPQNAVKALTVAVANRADAAGVYRVVVEQAPSEAGGRSMKGFAGFPVKNIALYRVLATSGDPADVGSAPLVEMDESCTVSVPAGTAGIVRFEFDAADVLPRTYRGCPICRSEASRWCRRSRTRRRSG